MKKDGFMKDAFTLFLITLVSGVCLGGVYEITKGPIAEAEMAAKIDAYKVVYADAANFKAADDLDEAVAGSAEALAACNYGKVAVDEVVYAVDASEASIGYVVTATSNDGFGGAITVSVGISQDGTVQGIEFLTLTETAGLGMNAQNPEYKDQYAGKQVESFSVVKGGASADNEIDALSGATITSDAVTNAVNAAVYFVNNCVAQ